MKGAIFFSGKYGSTEQYANWIGKATGLPVFDIKDAHAADLSEYDFLVLGSSIVYFKLTIRKWASANLSKLNGRSKILFSVSGAGPSDKLERWVAASFPSQLLTQMEHVALRGKLDHSKLSWWLRKILWMGSLFNPDPQARKEERGGFDYMDKSSIEPILKIIEQFQYSGHNT
ncbi:flavodoxin domain-containing protein [Arenibacter echinorum]|uniref:Menaquinone-dependent protoporphyrinogen IX oxidase n=1 Tax=Arenibacter echinorum TaxID=440515 RepID=A0A327R6B9_9FLAO|nr:flavodoxin domain-containing protein [Arenibacter echinorum]RAJ11512.1 menaquinone-dependent protoporphyrinogen IX oxidase [Arenibacter echinorum]